MIDVKNPYKLITVMLIFSLVVGLSIAFYIIFFVPEKKYERLDGLIPEENGYYYDEANNTYIIIKENIEGDFNERYSEITNEVIEFNDGSKVEILEYAGSYGKPQEFIEEENKKYEELEKSGANRNTFTPDEDHSDQEAIEEEETVKEGY